MSALAPTLQAFFTDRLARQRGASPETVAAYRDALRLLVCFASHQVLAAGLRDHGSAALDDDDLAS